MTLAHTQVEGNPGSKPKSLPLSIAGRTFESRLFVGTGKYKTYDLMRDSLHESGCQVVTVAVRRERLYNEQGKSLLEFIDLSRYTILPNTAGCLSTRTRCGPLAHLGREILEPLDNPGAELGETRGAG